MDGNRLTTAGGTSSIDLMLKLIADDRGEDIANLVADQLIYSSIRTDQDTQRLSVPTRIGVRHPKLSQVIQMLNNPAVVNNIKSSDGRIQKWLSTGKSADEVVELIYLSTVSRRPTTQERELIAKHLKTLPDSRTGLFDVQFALLNSNEFLLRH